MAKSYAQQRRELQRKAQLFQEAARKRLEQMVRPGQGQGSTGIFGLGAGITGGPPLGNSAGEFFKFGQPISDADVKRFMGTNPYLAQLKKMESDLKSKPSRRPLGRMTKDVSRAADQAQQNYLAQLAASAQEQADRANFENEYRYQQGLGELATLRGRNTERVQNFGKAAKADLEERFGQSLGDVTANLTSRGLGNSTVLSAFEAKNARDKARELQRLSEMVDDRASRYDTADTQNLVGFVERRNDVGPDFSHLAALAQAYGASGASGMEGLPPEQPGAAMRTVGGGRGAEEELVDYTQFSPARVPYAVQATRARNSNYPSLNALASRGQYMDPMGIAHLFGNGLVPSPQPVISNRYPQRRSQTEYRQLQANMRELGHSKRVPRTRGQNMAFQSMQMLPASTALDQLQYFG